LIGIYKCSSSFLKQVDLVIRGLFICEFAYSHFKNWCKKPNSQSKCVFLSANLVFEVQNSGIYLQRITRPTCILIPLKKWSKKYYVYFKTFIPFDYSNLDIWVQNMQSQSGWDIWRCCRASLVQLSSPGSPESTLVCPREWSWRGMILHGINIEDNPSRTMLTTFLKHITKAFF
jgi:hypothetical protein